MKIALVHDYIKEFGGAERVLEVLSEMYPDAPIYTAFCDTNSNAYDHFKKRKIISSWFGYLPFASKLASPLRFLTPFIWGSFDFSQYDIVLSSASWYITKGFGTRGSSQKKPIEICYCHTPPRWLYGYTTSVNFQKFFLVRIYAKIVGFFLRKYDFQQAQKVNFFFANSKEVQGRIKKFYKRDAKVIYPPVSLPHSGEVKKEDYYFIVSRLVGAKGLEMAVHAAEKAGFQLKIAGASAGYFNATSLEEKAKGKVEFLGHVTDEELAKLYKSAKAFLALARDEDFGITPVESMMCGTPVIAYNGGGYKETIIDGKTGILFDDYSVDGLINAIKKFETLRLRSGKKMEEDCIKQAEKFSKKHFVHKIQEIVESAYARITRS